MKPMIILPPDAMSEENIKLLRENDICVVVASNPAAVRFVDPIPAISSRTDIENAAIQLSRKVLNPGIWNSSSDVPGMLAKLYIECLIKGTPLDPLPSQKEVEKKAYDFERIEEMRRLAKQDAREEQAAKKAAAKPK